MGPWAVKEMHNFIASNCEFDEVYGCYEVSKEQLYQAKNAYRDKSETALDKGLGIHEIFEMILKGEPLPAMPDSCVEDYLATIEVFREWIKTYNAKTIFVEKEYVTDRFGTRIDWVVELDSSAWQSKRWCTKHDLTFPQPVTRHYCVVDFKTSAAFYDEMGLQLAAQCLALDGTKVGVGERTRLIMRINTEKHKLYVKHYGDEWDYCEFMSWCNTYWKHYKWESKYAHAPKPQEIGVSQLESAGEESV
jgi:hypothetical protein